MRTGEDLFEEGAASDSLYVLAGGRLEVLKRVDGSLRRQALVHPGEMVGEIGLLSNRPRAATVRAARDSVVAQLPAAEFERLVSNNPSVLLGVTRLLIDWIDRSAARGARTAHSTVIAVVAASPRAPVRWLVDALVGGLGGREAVAHLDASAQASALDLQRIESSHRSLVLDAGAEDNEWAGLCMRNADVVLLVARDDDDPSSAPPWLRLATGAAKRDLVLITESGVPKNGLTERWMEVLSVSGRHRVRRGRMRDVGRLTRLITDRGVGIALAGGGARGFAHLGVLQALADHRIPIDCVAGTSMGSVVGATLAAFGGDLPRTVKEVRARLHEKSPFDAPVPYLTPFSSKRFDATLAELFGDMSVADTLLRFFCMSCTLESARSVAHERGPLWRAVRASCALPGVFPAIEIDGELNVDGAFLDNLPAERLARAVPGKTIAVNVMPAYDSMALDAMATTSRQKAALKSMMSFARLGRAFLPNVLMRSFFLGSIRDAARIKESVDLYIEPDTSPFGFLEMSAFDRLFDLGRASADAEIRRWLKTDPDVPREAWD